MASVLKGRFLGFWLTLVVLAGSVFPGRVASAETVQSLPAPTGYVNDFAGALSPSTESQLEALCAQVDQKAHTQIAVVTIKTLDDEPIDQFANDLFTKWGVGAKGTDKGVLLLFAIQDRRYRIEVGYGLEGILPDGKVGDIGRAMVPYLKQSDYNSAVALGTVQVAKVIAADAGVTLTAPAPAPAPLQEQPQSRLGLGHFLLLAFIFFILVMIVGRTGPSGLLWFLLGNILGGGLGGGGRGRDDDRGGGGGFGGFGGGSSGGGGASGNW
jgi:uncharacterized protein